MKKVKLALIGAGERGQNSYAPYVRLHGYEAEFVAVAEPDAVRRDRFRDAFRLAEAACYTSAEDFFAQPKMADAVMLCTQDSQHFAYAVQAIEKGYHLLLEKPISPSAWECLTLQKLAEQKGTLVLVCHVLRYTPFYRKLKEVLDSGAIGDIVSIQHTENVGYWHYGHSYVRGNWRRSDESSPMILAKCCHDMDILAWLLQSRCKSISSYGGLHYFNAAHAPAGAPARCLDGCPASASCPFYAPAMYLSEDTDRKWPTAQNVLGRHLSWQQREDALRTGPYGRCVFHSDNDVVDHQVAGMEFENGATVAFTMCGFTNENDRTMKLMGTKGEIRARLERGKIEVTQFGPGVMTGPAALHNVSAGASNHSGGDDGIMAEFLSLLRGQKQNSNSIAQSVHSHIMALAAEQSRLTGQTVDIVAFEQSVMRP